MRKFTAVVLLTVITVTGLVVGFVAPPAALAYNPPTALECYIVPSWPCVMECCYNAQISGCFPIGCASW